MLRNMLGEMRVLALLGQKGGSGKTTLAVHIGVAAQQAGESVGLLDCDPQGSARSWVALRENGDPAVAALRPSQVDSYLLAGAKAGITLMIVDTAPHATTSVYDAILKADLVLLPCRPSILDLAAVERAVRIAESAKRPGAFVVNAAPPRAAEVDLTLEVLGSYAFPVAPIVVGQRQAYVRAMGSGQAVTEFDPTGKAAGEMRALWSWIAEQTA